MSVEKASDNGAASKEARAVAVPRTAGNPQYPSGLTLYLVMIALMLSMFLVGRPITTWASLIFSRWIRLPLIW